MKFLILAACVCLAAAAPQRSVFGRPVQQATRTVAGTGVAAAAVAASPFVVAADATAHGAKYASQYVAGKDAEVPIVRSQSDVRPDGYQYSWEAGNGIAAEAVGTLKKVGDQEAVVATGAYRYTAPDGTPVEFQYVADENGYQPQSALLPTPPPVPEVIARSLEWIAAHPYKEVH